MEKVTLSEVLDLVAREPARDAMRTRIIARKRNRRVAVGDHLTFVFENRDTVLFQVQEMIRTERIVHEDKIREELDAHNALIPSAGELSATLSIEIPELARMSPDEVRKTVNRFQGLDREGVRLVAGGQRVAARFEEGHRKQEMAAVHYLRFALPAAAQAALADPAQPVRLVVDDPDYRAEAALRPAVREELIADLR